MAARRAVLGVEASGRDIAGNRKEPVLGVFNRQILIDDLGQDGCLLAFHQTAQQFSVADLDLTL
ncbi:hypothetical protein D3C76_1782740 [compost metagenome]